MPDATKSLPSTTEENGKAGFSRRGFLRGAGMTAVVAAVADTGLTGLAKAAEPDAKALNTPISGEVKITLAINGANRDVTVEPRTTLLSAIRRSGWSRLGSPGQSWSATWAPAARRFRHHGRQGRLRMLDPSRWTPLASRSPRSKASDTPENLSPGAKSDVRNRRHDVPASAPTALSPQLPPTSRKTPNPNLDQIKQGLKGNFCRCGTYPHVFAAALGRSRKRCGREGKSEKVTR